MNALLQRGSPDEVAVLRERVRALASSAEDGAALPTVTSSLEEACAAASDLGVVYLPWIRRSHSVAPVLAAWKLRFRGQAMRWIDLDGESGSCGAAFLLVQSLRLALYFVLDRAARALATLHAWIVPPSAEDTADEAAAAQLRGGRLRIVLPILPDLSHTFVYREAATMLRNEADSELLVLERGSDLAPVHAEARALLPMARFFQLPGILRHYGGIFVWMLIAPRRTSRLLRRYRSSPAGMPGLFGRLPLREPRHPANAFALAAGLRGSKPGPIHVYGSTYATNVVMGACDLLGWPYSLTSYVDFDFAYNHRMLGDKLASADFFRVCTGFCQTRLRELVPGTAAQRVPVILFGLDLSAWDATASPQDDNRLVSACRVVPKKGLHLVPPTLAALRREGLVCRWTIAGDGPERARITALAEQHGVSDLVTWLGAVPSERVSEELLRSDLAVLPCVVAEDGERDGIPIFLTEAMALGVPVLTTPVSGIPELIEDGVSGYLATPDDVASLTSTLRKALTDRATRMKIAQGGRHAVRSTLDIEDSARVLLARIRGTTDTAESTQGSP